MAQPQAEGMNGTAGQQLASNGEHVDPGGFKLKFCTVCASNNNRSVFSVFAIDLLRS
jgi:RNA polymerase II subunit A C-terminal domain phosphatase SSU72